MSHGPDHEYAILNGINRSGIGRWIAVLSAGVSSTVILGVLALFDLAQRFGWGQHIPPLVMWPLSAATIYLALYWLFDRYIWKIGHVRKLLKIPLLAGQWECTGKTLTPERNVAHDWRGDVTITQSWDRLKIRLETGSSISTSVAAAISYDEADGFLVLYHYKNEPRADSPVDMRAHRGFAELRFIPDCTMATGEYFNGINRFTFGTMNLERL